MSLTLLDSAAAPASATPPATSPPERPPCPVAVGDRVHVPHAVETASGSFIPSRHYEVLAVDWMAAAPPGASGRAVEAAPCWRLTIEAALDTSKLPKIYHRPTREQQMERARAGLPPLPVPFAAQPRRVFLFPGDYTAYDPKTTDGRHPATLEPRSRALE